MANIDIGKSPKSSAVLPFYGTGAFYFLILSILLFVSSDSLQGYFLNPHLLSIVHTATLGWATMIIFGAAYQLLPVICERDLFSANLCIWSYIFLTVGASLLIICFWNFTTGFWMILGGSLVVVSVLLFLINTIATTRICKQYSIQRLFIATSAIWLLCTVSLGLLLAIQLYHPIFSAQQLTILKLHAHVGLGGWLLQLIMGVSIKLIPMFLLGKSTKTYLMKWAYGCINAALLLFIMDGYFNGIQFRCLFYALLATVSVLFWFSYLYNVYCSRLKKVLDISMKHSLLSMICLTISIVLIPIVYIASGNKWAILYGMFLLLGWISSLIVGMSFKTLPFIVWNNHYKQLNGIVKVPLPKQLYSEKWLKYQFRLFICSLILLAVAIIVQWAWLLKISALLWMATACLFFLNICKVLSHKTKIVENGIRNR